MQVYLAQEGKSLDMAHASDMEPGSLQGPIHSHPCCHPVPFLQILPSAWFNWSSGPIDNAVFSLPAGSLEPLATVHTRSSASAGPQQNWAMWLPAHHSCNCFICNAECKISEVDIMSQNRNGFWCLQCLPILPLPLLTPADSWYQHMCSCKLCLIKWITAFQWVAIDKNVFLHNHQL